MERKTGQRVTNTVTANANMVNNADSGMLPTAKTCARLVIVDSRQTAPTNMQVLASLPTPSAPDAPNPLREPTPLADDQGRHHRRGDAEMRSQSHAHRHVSVKGLLHRREGGNHENDLVTPAATDLAADRITMHSFTWVRHAQWQQTYRMQTLQL